MSGELLKHPSNIARSASEYLAEPSGSKKTKRARENILFYFVESLRGDPSAVVENEDGEFLLKHDWKDYYGGAISSFIDWWLPRKVMGPGNLQSRALGVMRKWVNWCYEKGYFDKKHYDDYMSALSPGKKKDIQRLSKAGDLLYRLHTPRPGEGFGKTGKVVPINRYKKNDPEIWEEGYMKIVKLDKTSGYLQNEAGKRIGPVTLGKPLVDILRVGDVMNIVLGKFGKIWRVLESGNVYGEDIIF